MDLPWGFFFPSDPRAPLRLLFLPVQQPPACFPLLRILEIVTNNNSADRVPSLCQVLCHDLNLHINPLGRIHLSAPYYRWENWAPERWWTFPKLAELDLEPRSSFGVTAMHLCMPEEKKITRCGQALEVPGSFQVLTVMLPVVFFLLEGNGKHG